MQHAKETGAIHLDSQGLASKLSLWMLQKKGLDEKSGSMDEAGIEKIVCGTCMGSGTTPSADGRKAVCRICQGVGFHMIRRFDPADRFCPACGGMGRVEMPDSGEVGNCPRCDGSGLIRSWAGRDSAPDGN